MAKDVQINVLGMKRVPRAIIHLSADKLPGSYKSAPKLWRHSLHTVCSRVAMFPPQLVHYFILRYSSEGDTIADPWAGVGTVPLQASLDGRVGVGSDISPEAWVVMAAKLQPITLDQCYLYINEIARRMNRMKDKSLDNLGKRLGIKCYYNHRTLQEILRIRVILTKDRKSKDHRKRRSALFITALMIGILHGDREESLSLKMDSSKAYSPLHVRSMQRKWPNEYRAGYRCVISCLKTKAKKVLKDEFAAIRGRAYLKDARDLRTKRPAKLVLTSPPYVDVHTYAYDNRARLWFLGYDYRLVQKRIISVTSLNRYFRYLSGVLLRVTKIMENNSTCVLVLGDVPRNGKILRIGERFARYWLTNHGKIMRLDRIIVDRLRPTHRRYFNLGASHGIKCERILVFQKGKPTMNKVSFNWKPFLQV